MTNLKGKVAYITGGSKGIGFGIAQSLLHEGMKVAITSRSATAAISAAEKLGNKNILALESNVQSLSSEINAIQKTESAFGRLDVVIANAGVGHFGPIDNLTEAAWKETIDTNLTGVFNTVKASVEVLKKSLGYLITIASLAGTNFFENGAAYNASKFGLVGFTQAVMLDLRKYNIKVTTIMPGSVSSSFNSHVAGTNDTWKIQPEDLGQMVVDLLKINPRTLPSKIEVRPSVVPAKR